LVNKIENLKIDKLTKLIDKSMKSKNRMINHFEGQNQSIGQKKIDKSEKLIDKLEK
jgi:hypothetical protein